ncbi:MAG: hypothetical protein GWM98_23995, partial [Nitrospinaceae bacterium]|nr:hypothetical protein [Nitrospinaceae bacterium]
SDGWETGARNGRDRVLLLNGSALHARKDLESLLNAPSGQTLPSSLAVPLDSNHLESFLSPLQEGRSPDLSRGIPLQEGTGGEAPDGPAPVVYVPGADSARIQKPEDFQTQHERLLNRSGLNQDSWVTRILSRPVSRGLTRLFLKTPLRPNHITLLSFFLGLAAAGCFWAGTYGMNVLGGLLLLGSTWVDGTDGEIARLKFMESQFGAKLDILCDNLVHFFVFASIGWGVSLATGEALYQYLGGIAAVGSLVAFLLLRSLLLAQKAPAPEKAGSPPSGNAWVEQLANRDFIHFLLVMALADLLNLFILVAAVGVCVFAGALGVARFRHSRNRRVAAPQNA